MKFWAYCLCHGQSVFCMLRINILHEPSCWFSTASQCLSMPGPPAPERPRPLVSSFHTAWTRLGENHTAILKTFLLLTEVKHGYMFSWQRDKLSTCDWFPPQTSPWLAPPLSRKETLYYFSLSLCGVVTHLHSLNEKTMRTCALMDNQKNCFPSSKMDGQNWSLDVLTGLFSKRESYKSTDCKIML